MMSFVHTLKVTIVKLANLKILCNQKVKSYDYRPHSSLSTSKGSLGTNFTSKSSSMN